MAAEKRSPAKNWSQLFGFPFRRAASIPPAGAAVIQLLLVTRDDRFYCYMQDIATSNGWDLHRAAGVQEAAEVIRSQSTPLVLYDWDGVEVDWRDDLRHLTGLRETPCILLASPVVDENLREEVMRCHGYDVVSRSADRQELARSVSFAWFWTIRSRAQFSGNPKQEAHN